MQLTNSSKTQVWFISIVIYFYSYNHKYLPHWTKIHSEIWNRKQFVLIWIVLRMRTVDSLLGFWIYNYLSFAFYLNKNLNFVFSGTCKFCEHYPSVKVQSIAPQTKIISQLGFGVEWTDCWIDCDVQSTFLNS